MQYQYGEFNGQPFPTPDSLFPSPQVIQFILQHGDEAMQAMENFEDEALQQMIQEMIDAGLLERDEQTGELKLTPKMLQGIEHRALMEIFGDLKRGSRDGHPTMAAGRTNERADGTKPYEFGDPLSEIDLGATMQNVLRRQQAEHARSGAAVGGPRLPLNIQQGDFELHVTEGQTDVAMCILLDMSGSMMRYGRFYQAKRVALGMRALMRRQFPLDTVDFVGFHSLAEMIREDQLPLLTPKPVTIFDHTVRLRLPLDQAMTQPKGLPLHFTNLQLGLRQARQILARRGAANKMIFIITDGQPTAHVQPGPTGQDMLYLLYPPTDETTMITLKEALTCQQRGIQLATFALTDDYWGLDWVGFVDQLTKLTRGVAYYCSSDDLGATVIESYLSGKKRKSYVG